MTSPSARFAATCVALTVAHEVGDHWVQIDAQAVAKGKPGPEGARACGIHVATYTATQAAALYAANRALGLGLRPGRAAIALAISAATHYIADRQGGHWQDRHPRGVVRLAAVTGHAGWLERDPGAGYLLDQSWHKAWIGVAALIAAGGGVR
ncbi:MAG TPA: transcriptional regulator [Streptosporangiaceae bacterium]|nr:transcriptional regulator [Streptosporangiaceae bacterium]